MRRTCISGVLLLLVAACGEDSDNVNPLAPSAVGESAATSTASPPPTDAGEPTSDDAPVTVGALSADGPIQGLQTTGTCQLNWYKGNSASALGERIGATLTVREGEHVDNMLVREGTCTEKIGVRNADLVGTIKILGHRSSRRWVYADSPARVWGSSVDNSVTSEPDLHVRFRAGSARAVLVIKDDDAQLNQPDPLQVTLKAPPSASAWTPNQSYSLGHVLNWNNAQGDPTFPNLVNHAGWWIRTRQAAYGAQRVDGGRPGSAQYPLFPDDPNDWDPASTVRTVEIRLDRPWGAGDYRIRLRAVGSARLTPWETSSRAAVANDFRSAILTVPSGRGFQHESVTVVCPSRVSRNGSTRPARRGTVRLQVLAPYQGVEVRPNQVRVC